MRKFSKQFSVLQFAIRKIEIFLKMQNEPTFNLKTN
ncbi:hypothetical protein N483_08660 [Pseudoalteromonas luteoviolacea NCIMB 1944]|nr:hypothetical protein N483_08660 [Pseudoalteromonas luteoviolacea NCIMB 1944]